jgi:hypothetical protein
MKKSITDAINSVQLFFGGSYDSYDSITPIRNFLGLYSIEMCLLGNSDINKKHKSHYGHLIISNKNEDRKIVFVHNHLPNSNYATNNVIAMFCVKDDAIFEYKSNDKLFVTTGEFNGYSGLNMLAVAKKFCEGIIEEDLIVSENELIKDIVAYSKSIA